MSVWTVGASSLVRNGIGPVSNQNLQQRKRSLKLVPCCTTSTGGDRASIDVLHFRNISTLSKQYTIYAIDLVGFGASDKPAGFSYTMEAWVEVNNEVIGKPTVLIGNTVGSLACAIATSEESSSKTLLVQGLVLLNCSGGMNSKAIVDDWRIKLLLPLLWFIDFLLKQRIISEPANDEGALDAFVSIITSPPGPNPV
ncbi:hypothetical protein QYF36_020141 [Acer negundo]|nr:hypothetical protein QYF36_020141 [Acer negundo]